MAIEDTTLTAVRKEAIRNRGKACVYREFVSQTSSMKTGVTTPVFRNKDLRALVSGIERVADGMKRTFRFIKSQLPEYPPSMKSVVQMGDYQYRIVDWRTSQHEDVVDIEAVSP